MTFAYHYVAKLGKIARQRRQRANPHVLAFVWYQSRDGKTQRRVIDSPPAAQRAGIA